jgi:tRNA (guanosine-2'-O-)-methyltransferase
MTPERFQRLHDVLSHRQPDLTVVTDYVHKGRNLSAIVRNCDAVGIGNMHAVIPASEYRQFRGTAKGSHQWVKVVRHATIESAINPLKENGYQIVTAHLTASAVDFREVDYTKPTAILMGAEKFGVSNAGIDLADVSVTIPMVGMVESYNVSVAAGIILSEAQYQRQKAGLYDKNRLDQSEYEQLFFEWAHPKIKHFCMVNNVAYPPLNEEGELSDPSGWYANVREQLANR